MASALTPHTLSGPSTLPRLIAISLVPVTARLATAGQRSSVKRASAAYVAAVLWDPLRLWAETCVAFTSEESRKAPICAGVKPSKVALNLPGEVYLSLPTTPSEVPGARPSKRSSLAVLPWVVTSSWLIGGTGPAICPRTVAVFASTLVGPCVTWMSVTTTSSSTPPLVTRTTSPPRM